MQTFAKLRKNLRSKREQQNLSAEARAQFIFLSGVSPGEDLVVDSVSTIKIIKDREMFVRLEENFKVSVIYANFFDSKDLGKINLASE